MNNKTIKENILKLRIEMNLTQEQMASKLGISRQAYVNLEHGKTRMVSPVLEKIAEVAGVETESLVLGYNVRENQSSALRDIETLTSSNMMLQERVALLQDVLDTKNHSIDNLEKFVAFLTRPHQEKND